MKEASIVRKLGKRFHWINASLEDRREDHQSTIVDIEGTISNQSLSILIDPRETLSYITPKVMEDCELAKIRHEKPWSVELATGARKKVT